MNETAHNYEDEIELMDILLYFWKWKYFFLAGIFLSAVLFTTFSFYTESHKPKTYEIEFTLEAGTVIDKYGNESYIKSPDNIVEKIKSGDFNEGIKEILQKNYTKNDYNQLAFKVIKKRIRGSLIPLSHNTTDVDQGIASIKALVDTINNAYFDITLKLKNNIEDLVTEIGIIKDKIQANRDYLEKIKIRHNEVMYALNTIDKPNKIGNREDISDEALSWNVYYEKKKLEAMYKDKLIEYTGLIIETSLVILRNEEKLKILKKRINFIPEEYSGQPVDIQVVKIYKPPIVKETPPQTQTFYRFFFGPIIGFFIILFLTFFVEYFQRYKTRKGEK